MSESTSPILNLSNVSVNVGGTDVLHDVDWRVEPGQHWFVLGPNGSGKSTLMNLVMGYNWPKLGGSVEVLGMRFGECMVGDIRKHIGGVSATLKGWQGGQSLVLNVVLSGFDGSIGLYREATLEEGQLAKDILDSLEVADLGLRHFGTLSSGEQMRVLIARALVSKPQMLILDEPCCHLDFKSREYFLDALRRLAATPDAPAMMFVTHHVDDIIDAFTHGMLLRDGRVLAAGTAAEVLTEPRLSEAFGVDLSLERHANRYWCRLR